MHYILKDQKRVSKTSKTIANNETQQNNDTNHRELLEKDQTNRDEPK